MEQVVKAALVGLLIVIVSDPAFSAPSRNTLPPATPRSPPTIQIGSDHSPAIVRGDIVTHMTREDAEVQQHSDVLHLANEISLNNATWLLAIFTVVLAIIAIVQVFMFLAQLKLTRESVVDAEVAAKAAMASAEALPKIERAYLFVSCSIRFTNEPVPGTKLARRVGIFTLTMTNYGKTPAILKRLRAYPVYSDHPPQELIPARNNATIPSGLVVGSGGVYEHTERAPIEIDQWKEIVGDVLYKFYIVGTVEYDDILGQEHATGFCWHTTKVGGSLTLEIAPSNLNRYT